MLLVLYTDFNQSLLHGEAEQPPCENKVATFPCNLQTGFCSHVNNHCQGGSWSEVSECCPRVNCLCLKEQISQMPGELHQRLPRVSGIEPPELKLQKETKRSKQFFKKFRLSSTAQYFPQFRHEMRGNMCFSMNCNHYPH